MHALRRLMQGGPDHPKAPLGNNFRPPQPLLHRPVRTNIDFRSKQPNAKACPSMYKDVHYKGEFRDFHISQCSSELYFLHSKHMEAALKRQLHTEQEAYPKIFQLNCSRLQKYRITCYKHC